MELIEFANSYNVKGLRHYCADLLNKHFRDNDLDPMEFSQLLKMGLSNEATDLLEVYLVHAHNSKKKKLKDLYKQKISANEKLTLHDFALLKNICEKNNLSDFLETLLFDYLEALKEAVKQVKS